MSTDLEVGLAFLVAVGDAETWHKTGCVAWVDSRDSACGKARAEGLLCKRHHPIALKRFEKYKAKIQRKSDAQAKRRKERLEKFKDIWVKELESVNAELERRTSLPTSDRAAWGGAVHPQLKKVREQKWSDNNIKRVTFLMCKKEKLERNLEMAKTSRKERG